MPTPEKIAEFLGTLTTLLPVPYGPAIAAALRLVQTLIDQGRDPAAEIQAMHARYSAEAQKIADDWK